MFVMVGRVEHSRFLQFNGQHILPFVEDTLLVASLTLLWVSALLSAAIYNIPFMAGMIPILLSSISFRLRFI